MKTAKYKIGDLLEARAGIPWNQGCVGRVTKVGQVGDFILYYLTADKLGPWTENQVTPASSDYRVGQKLFDTKNRHGATITAIHEVMNSETDSTTYYAVSNSQLWFTVSELKARYKKIRS